MSLEFVSQAGFPGIRLIAVSTWFFHGLARHRATVWVASMLIPDILLPGRARDATSPEPSMSSVKV
jgi:hypothetical protein